MRNAVVVILVTVLVWIGQMRLSRWCWTWWPSKSILGYYLPTLPIQFGSLIVMEVFGLPAETIFLFWGAMLLAALRAD